jgi:hypothetical protein
MRVTGAEKSEKAFYLPEFNGIKNLGMIFKVQGITSNIYQIFSEM